MYEFRCKNHGIIKSKDVVWGTLKEDVAMTFCPHCKAEIKRFSAKPGGVTL
jgi:predicted nucleic acid-binding Zn ribbon protein